MRNGIDSQSNIFKFRYRKNCSSIVAKLTLDPTGAEFVVDQEYERQILCK